MTATVTPTRWLAARVGLPVLLAGSLLAGCGGADAAPAGPDPSAAGPDPSASASAGVSRQRPSYALPACPDLPHRRVVPGGLPDLTLPCLGSGPDLRLADLRGTPTVLNVWAAWCQICAEEMPVLAAGMREAGDRVRFLGVHYKAPAGYGRQSAADFGVAFPSVQDTDGDRTTLALRPLAGPPQTFFFAADGSLAGRHAGAITSTAQLAGLVQRYLGVAL